MQKKVKRSHVSLWRPSFTKQSCLKLYWSNFIQIIFNKPRFEKQVSKIRDKYKIYWKWTQVSKTDPRCWLTAIPIFFLLISCHVYKKIIWHHIENKLCQPCYKTTNLNIVKMKDTYFIKLRTFMPWQVVEIYNLNGKPTFTKNLLKPTVAVIYLSSVVYAKSAVKATKIFT